MGGTLSFEAICLEMLSNSRLRLKLELHVKKQTLRWTGVCHSRFSTLTLREWHTLTTQHAKSEKNIPWENTYP